MNQPTPGEETPAPVPQRPRRRNGLIGIGLIAALLCALFATVAWMTASQDGFSFFWYGVGRITARAVTVDRVEGTFWQGFVLDGVHVRSADSDVRIDRLALDWQPHAMWQGQLWVTRLELGQIVVQSLAPNAPSVWPTLPADLGLPFKIRIDELRVGSMTLNPEGWSAYALDAVYGYDGSRHQLMLKHLRLAQGSASARLTLANQRPFALDGELRATGENQGAKLQASGDLQALRLQGTVHTQSVDVQLKGLFAPFAAFPYQRILSLDLKAAGVDPHTILADWPQARLDVAAHIEPDAVRGAAGELKLTNRQAGPWSNGQLPLKALNGSFLVHGPTLSIDNMTAQLTQGEIRFKGGMQASQFNLDAMLSGVGLRALYASLPADVVSGHAILNGTPAAPRLSADLQGRLLRAQLDLAIERQAAGPSLQVHKLVLQAGGGALDLSGQLNSARRFSFRGQLVHADPARLYPNWPRGDINAELETSGQLTGPVAASLNLKFIHSQLSHSPLLGTLKLAWSDQRLKQLEADLQLAGNRLDAHGAYGAPGDRLQVQLDAPVLAALGFGFGGAARGRLDLAGTPSAPHLNADLQANQLRLPGNIRAQSLNLVGDLQPGAGGRFDLNLAVDGVQGGAWRIEYLRARAAGTRAHHTLTLEARAEQAAHSFGLGLDAQGGWTEASRQWRGVIEHASVSGMPNISLLSPLAVTMGPERIDLGAARLNVAGGLVTLDGLTRQANGALQTRGRFDGLTLAEFRPWFVAPFEQDLRLDGAWNLQPDGRGSLTLERQGGDITLETTQARVPLGLSAARAELDWGQGQTRMKWNLVSRLGQIEGQGALAAAPAQITAITALNAQLKITLPDLSLLSALAGEQAKMAGVVNANLNLSGPVSAPGVYGEVNGHDLLWQDRKTGIRLSGGELIARLDGRKLLLDRLHFVSGNGEILAQGNADLNGRTPEATIKVAIRHFSVFDRPDRKLIVSGNGELAITDRLIALTGQVRADQGQLTLPKENMPTLSPDVVVLGRAAPEPSAFASLPLTVALTLDLGDHFTYSGEGLNVELAGQVAVKTQPDTAPSAHGQVRVVKGSYKAYGQELDIESGTITFVGALDNPTLNVRARRHLSPVGAGVEVLGSVSDPSLRLISNDPMSDRDRLAWLVLGHAADNNTQDSNLLALAAGSFAAGSLNQRMGLFDDLGVTSKESRTLLNGTVNPAEQVLTVGKQLTQTFYLGYEYGLSSSQQAVKLMYQLSGNWSVILHVGSDASAESRYTLRFD